MNYAVRNNPTDPLMFCTLQYNVIQCHLFFVLYYPSALVRRKIDVT